MTPADVLVAYVLFGRKTQMGSGHLRSGEPQLEETGIPSLSGYDLNAAAARESVSQ